MFNLGQLSSITQIESGETLQSHELRVRILNRAQEIKDLYKVGPGNSVLILQNNSIAFFINLLAVFHLKATAIPLDPLSSIREIETIKAHSEASLVISENGEDYIGTRKVDDLLDISLVLYTSGTTGIPKGVLISTAALKKKLDVLQKNISAEERKNTLCALPTFFGHGLICNSLFSLFYGKAFFVAKKFDLKLVSCLPEIIEKHQITFFSSVPSVWLLILNFTEKTNYSSSLKRVHCASSPLTAERSEQIKKWLGEKVSFYNIYGITEMLGWFASSCSHNIKNSSAFKNFWDTQYKVGEHDELMLKSEFMFSGYLKNEAAYRNVLTESGFFRTGDIFERNELKGRLSLVINKNSIKVYPQEIDALLMNSGLVNDVHTFGIEDEFCNEIIAVLICPLDQNGVEQIKTFCRSNLSSQKIPDKFFVVEKIERNARGKVSAEYINQLRERFKNE